MLFWGQRGQVLNFDSADKPLVTRIGAIKNENALSIFIVFSVESNN